jgi:hypothetical protein
VKGWANDDCAADSLNAIRLLRTGVEGEVHGNDIGNFDGQLGGNWLSTSVKQLRAGHQRLFCARQGGRLARRSKQRWAGRGLGTSERGRDQQQSLTATSGTRRGGASGDPGMGFSALSSIVAILRVFRQGAPLIEAHLEERFVLRRRWASRLGLRPGLTRAWGVTKSNGDGREDLIGPSGGGIRLKAGTVAHGTRAVGGMSASDRIKWVVFKSWSCHGALDARLSMVKQGGGGKSPALIQPIPESFQGFQETGIIG